MTKFLDAIDMTANKVMNMLRPTADADAVTKRYADDYLFHNRRTLFNGDFRIPDPADPTKFLGWTITKTGGADVVRDTTKTVYGTYSAKFTVGATTADIVTLTSDPVDVFNLTTAQLQSLYDALAQILYSTTSNGGVLSISVTWQVPGGGINGAWSTIPPVDFSTGVAKIGAIFAKTDPPPATAQAVLIIRVDGRAAGACTVNVSGCKLEEALSAASIATLDIKQAPIQMTDDAGITKYGHSWDSTAGVVKQFGEVKLETGAKVIAGGGAILDATLGYKAQGASPVYPLYDTAGTSIRGALEYDDDESVQLASFQIGDFLYLSNTQSTGNNIVNLNPGGIQIAPYLGHDADIQTSGGGKATVNSNPIIAPGNQSGNKGLFSPANGSSGAMAPRALVAADMPAGVPTGGIVSLLLWGND